MEKGFGGPVWHASVKAPEAQKLAEEALAGVGDAALGEWRANGAMLSNVVHIRRRLSVRECIEHGLSMIDMRGTPEGRQRLTKLFQQHPHLREHAAMIGEWT